MAPVGKVLRTCLECGEAFLTHPYVIRQGRGNFHSVSCASRYRGRQIQKPVGTEIIRKLGDKLERFVRVSVEPGAPCGGWKRKAVVVMEEFLGRELSPEEKCHLLFNDPDDRLNCSLSNLLLPTVGKLVEIACADCGKVRVYKATVSHRNYRYCRPCWNRHLGERRRCELSDLTAYQVGAVKLLLLDPRPIWGWQQLVARWFCTSGAAISSIKHGHTWKEIEPMAKEERWKALLKQSRQLAKQSSATLYDRVSLLREIYEDKDFLLEMRRQDKDPEEFLRAEIKDTCAANFSELLNTLKLFPRKDQWVNGDLNAMIATTTKTTRQKQREHTAKRSKKSGRSGQRKSARQWEEEYDDLQRKYEILLAEHKQLQKNYDAILKRIGGDRLAS